MKREEDRKILQKNIKYYLHNWISANCCDGDDRSAQGENGITDQHYFNSPDLYKLFDDAAADLTEYLIDHNIV